MKKILWLSLVSVLVFLACQKEDSSGKRENPFVNIDNPITVNMTDHADTVFLSWKPDGNLSVDKVSVSCENPSFSKTYDGGTGECVLTHVHFQTPTKITLKVQSGDKTKDVVVSANINGEDNFIKHKIYADKGGVSSGDGLYSVALPDNRSIFMMGDSYVCDVTNNTHPKGSHMYRNTYILFDHATQKHTPIYDFNGPGTYSSAAVPPGQYYELKWYWPGDGYVQGNRLFIFQSLMYMKGEGMWGFAYENMHLLEYSLPDLKLEKDALTRDPNAGHRAKGEEIEEHYGVAVLNDGDYVYFYAQVSTGSGLGEVSSARVARANPDSPYGAWEYYDGSGWAGAPESGADMAGLASVAISSQFEVFKLGEKYVLLTEDKWLWENAIYTFVSDSPQGPWVHKKLLYTIPPFPASWVGVSNCYNAMAHPQITKDGMFLISYCMNNEDQSGNVDGYRGRFIWVDPDWILK